MKGEGKQGKVEGEVDAKGKGVRRGREEEKEGKWDMERKRNPFPSQGSREGKEKEQGLGQ